MDIEFSYSGAECFIPDEVPEQEALERTTHLGIGAHPDDLEVLALDGILSCFHSREQWFTGITVTDGAGSVRRGPYASCTDDELRNIRSREQQKAASIGEYSAVYQLFHESDEVRGDTRSSAETEVRAIVEEAGPEVVYTHTPADRHSTHVAVATTAVRALQSMSKKHKPEKIYGCEVWRDLDWLPEQHKQVFDVGGFEHLISALIGVYDSQIRGGKRYDRALLGRHRSNATFFQSHEADQTAGLIFGMDLTPAIRASGPTLPELMQNYMTSFQQDVRKRIEQNSSPFGS